MKRLDRVTRCRGCGGWRWAHRDLRPCSTCMALGHWKAMRKAVGA